MAVVRNTTVVELVANGVRNEITPQEADDTVSAFAARRDQYRVTCFFGRFLCVVSVLSLQSGRTLVTYVASVQ